MPQCGTQDTRARYSSTVTVRVGRSREKSLAFAKFASQNPAEIRIDQNILKCQKHSIP